MADDSNGNKELARLRRRQQPDNKAEVATSQSAPRAALPAGDGDPSVDGDAIDSLEQRVLGAVRQAVTDVMQEGKQPSDLPLIDMDFEATSGAADGAKDVPGESNNPMADNLSANMQFNQSMDSISTVGASHALTIIIACTSLGFIVLAALFMLRGDDRNQPGLAAIDTTDRPVAGASSLSEVARLSSNEFATGPSSPQDALAAKEPLELSERQSAIRLAAKENAQREEAERKRLETEEEAERLSRAAKRATEVKALREAVERERLKAEEAERLSRVAKRAAEIRAQRAAAERERLEAEEAERQRRAAKRTAEEKTQRAAAERERLETEEAGRQRRAAKRAAEEKAQRVATEQKRLAAEEAERRRLALLRAAVEKARDDVTERKRQLEAKDERLRIASLREAQKEAQQEIAKRKQQEAVAAEHRRLASKRAALKKALAEIGVRDPRQIEDLATEAKKRLRSETVLAERLNSILEEAKQARQRSNRPPSSQEELPLAWTAEEKVRLKLEQLLTEINKEQKVASAPKLRAGPSLVRKRVTLQLKESNLKITGELEGYDKLNYVILLPSNELKILPIEHFDCISSDCPPVATK